MRKILFSLILVLFSAVSLFATNITVSSTVINNWRFGGTSAKLRIFASEQFVSSTGEIVQAGAISSLTWYKEIDCTVAGSTLTIPAVLNFPTTTDSNRPLATYTAVFFQEKVRRDFLLSDFKVPTSFGATVSWTQLIAYNQSAARPPNPLLTYYSSDQTNAQINAVLQNYANANSLVLSADTRLEKDLSLYSNSLSSAVSSIGGAVTVLNCSRAVSTNTLSIPKNIILRPTGECVITVNAGQALTIGTMLDPGSAKVFTSTAAGAKVLFAKGAVKEINTGWWTGNNGGDITDALNEALETTAANLGGVIYIPEGAWTSTGGHILPGSTTVYGVGNFPEKVTSHASQITLISSANAFLFKIGQTTFNIRLDNLLLAGNGTTGKDGLLLQGVTPNTSGDVHVSRVTFSYFNNGVNLEPASPPYNWQVQAINFDQCSFDYNTNAGVRSNSINTVWTFNTAKFFMLASGKGIDAVRMGSTVITNAEFGSFSNTAKGIVITSEHGQLTLFNVQSEVASGPHTFLESNLSDPESMITIISCIIQGKIQLNASTNIVSTGSKYFARTFRDAAFVGARIWSTGDTVRPLSVDDFLTAEPNPKLYAWTGGSKIVNEQTTDKYNSIERVPKTILSPDTLDGNASIPVLTLGHYSVISESKILLSLCRNDSAEVPQFCYNFLRQNSGDDAGRLKINGTQTGFGGFDVNGDFYAAGALRGQSVALIDGATITIPSKAGNYQYFTLGGNRTLAMAAFANPTERSKSDGQIVTLEIIQDGTGSRLLTFSSGAGQFAFGTDIASVTLTTGANKRDFVKVQYNFRADRWYVIDVKHGF